LVPWLAALCGGTLTVRVQAIQPVLIRPFLGQYRDLGVRARRAEQILGSGRAFLAVTAWVAIYVDPTEPARFAGLTYVLLAGYAVYSVALLLLVHRVAGISTGFSRAIHGIDIVSASALSFFSEGPVSPLRNGRTGRRVVELREFVRV
jgi:hypothetical protein